MDSRGCDSNCSELRGPSTPLRCAQDEWGRVCAALRMSGSVLVC